MAGFWSSFKVIFDDCRAADIRDIRNTKKEGKYSTALLSGSGEDGDLDGDSRWDRADRSWRQADLGILDRG